MALSNTAYDAIMRIYNDRQLENRKAQEARIEEVYQKIPRLAELSGEIASLSVRKARAMLEKDTDDFDLEAAIAGLAEERAVLLRAHGYPADYLELQYTCPKCKDTGLINGRKCDCFLRTEVDYLYRGSHDQKLLEEENFDRFILEYYPDDIMDTPGLSSRANAMQARETAIRFVQQFDTAFENLCIYGDTGVGKSFLSHCIAHELILRGHTVVYLTSHDLFDHLAQSAFDHNEDAADLSDQIFSCDLLIIDDLGTELTNAFVSSQLFLCVNERILKKKSTIISTNLSLEKFAEIYSERTFSRILGSYRLIRLFGRDIRIQKTLQGKQ
ncbi:MAG: ATP-binding protein [Eubacterium sp.]|nr:ATP-binding protein [Eubacterium sp.]